MPPAVAVTYRAPGFSAQALKDRERRVAVSCASAADPSRRPAGFPPWRRPARPACRLSTALGLTNHDGSAPRRLDLACGVCALDRRVAGGNRRRANATAWTKKQREDIVANESGPKAGVEGVVEDVKGRAKEAAGAVTGDESLKQEGEAQQDKAAAQRDVAAREAEAEKARAEARAAEAEQRSHQ